MQRVRRQTQKTNVSFRGEKLKEEKKDWEVLTLEKKAVTAFVVLGFGMLAILLVTMIIELYSVITDEVTQLHSQQCFCSQCQCRSCGSRLHLGKPRSRRGLLQPEVRTDRVEEDIKKERKVIQIFGLKI